MITIKDCEAFCEAEPSWVSELACRECLTMVQAYARAHEAAQCANDFHMPPVADLSATPSQRLAA